MLLSNCHVSSQNFYNIMMTCSSTGFYNGMPIIKMLKLDIQTNIIHTNKEMLCMNEFFLNIIGFI